MNNALTVREFGMTKVLKSGKAKASVNYAELRKQNPRMDGESRADWQKRIDSIGLSMQSSLDLFADAKANELIRSGFITKSVTHDPKTGDWVVQYTNPEKRSLRDAAKLEAKAQELLAKAAELRKSESVIEVAA